MPHDSAGLAGRPLVQVAVTVRDMDRARTFYRDVLSLSLMFEVPGMMFFQLGNARLLVGREVKEGTPIGGGVLYFDAPDLDALGSALEAKGVAFTGPATVVQRTETHELKLREFFDPDGNALALMGMIAR